MHYGTTWDRLNPGNIAFLEFTARRLMLIEEVIAENATAPNWEGASHYFGVEEKKGGAIMIPSLRAFVASELGKEAAVMKEKRKAKESRSGGKGGKGGAAEKP